MKERASGRLQNPPKEVPLESLFHLHRFERPFFSRKYLLFILYFPFGLALAIFRWFFFYLVGIPLYGFVLRTGWGLHTYLKWYPPLVGVTKRYHNKEILDQQPPPKIIVMNHRSDYDMFGLFHIKFRVLASPYWKSFQFFAESLGLHIPIIYARKEAVGSTTEETREQVRKEILEALHKSNEPLLLMPEGGTTNGNGLLQFNKFVFSLGEEIQPVAVRLHWPIKLPVNIDCLWDNIFSNMFWVMFTPLLIYDYTFLPRQRIREGETDAEFAKRVQELIANELGVPATNYTHKDKNSLRKQWKPI